MDLMLIPGGIGRKIQMNNPKVLDWVKKQSSEIGVGIECVHWFIYSWKCRLAEKSFRYPRIMVLMTSLKSFFPIQN
jgi:hypothetical protein